MKSPDDCKDCKDCKDSRTVRNRTRPNLRMTRMFKNWAIFITDSVPRGASLTSSRLQWRLQWCPAAPRRRRAAPASSSQSTTRNPSRPHAAKQQHLFATVRLALSLLALLPAGARLASNSNRSSARATGRCRDAAQKGHFCVRHFDGVVFSGVVRASILDGQRPCGGLGLWPVASLRRRRSFSRTACGARHTDARTFHAVCCCAGGCALCASARSPTSDPGGALVHP